ncbi:MAG: hypothetical protein ABIG66_04715 [Candidatus Kerfeldbacteria bacterium]
MGFGRRGRTFMALGRPDMTKRVEQQRKNRLIGARQSEEDSGTGMEATVHRELTDADSIQKGNLVTRIYRTYQKNWDEFVRFGRLESLHIDPHDIMAIIPHEVFLQANEPENVDMVVLESIEGEMSFILQEVGLAEHETWDEADLNVLSALGRSSVQYLKERKYLTEKDALLQYMRLKLYWPHGNDRSPMLCVADYKDRGFSNQVRKKVLKELDHLSDLNIDTRITIAPPELSTIIEGHDQIKSFRLQQLTRRERYQSGLPADALYDPAVVVEMEEMAKNFG